MEYQVIARKWRPQKFSDMIGQEHVTRTLRNEIVQNRTAHAYLFVGPRGIGKTTSARIFAKALNCTNPIDGEPCCKCSSCVSVADGSNIDVIEIDAASQNSVQNIRDLCEEVMFSPVKSKYKIYIVDEVHMLSDKAWNAFLKTVEEPPAHAKFIFATTEAHKVLATITSRCQRFDLRRIPTKLIVERLRFICDSESVKISNSALSAIARAADGGMRDAQSLLDQMISFFSVKDTGEISEEQVLSLFGLTSGNEIQNIVRSILLNDKASTITSIHSLSLKGKNLETLFEELLEYIRGVQLCKILPNPEDVLEESDETLAVFKNLADTAKADTIQRLLENLAPVGRYLHEAINKQVFLETIILKAMKAAHAVQIEDLIARLNQIRKNEELVLPDNPPPVIPVAEPLPPAVQTVAIPAAVPVQSPPPVQQKEPEPSLPVPVPQPVAAVPVPVEVTPEPVAVIPQEVTKVETPPAEALNKEESLPTVEKTPEPSLQAEPEDVSDDAIEDTEEEEDAMEHSVPEQPENIIEETGIQDEDAEVSSPEDSEETPPSENRLLKDVEKKNYSLDDLWHLLLTDIADSLGNITLRDYLIEGVPESFQSSLLTINFDEEFEASHMAAINKNMHVICTRLRAISGDKNALIKIVLTEGLHDRSSSIEKMFEAQKRVEKNEFVQGVMDLFGGHIVDVHHG